MRQIWQILRYYVFINGGFDWILNSGILNEFRRHFEWRLSDGAFWRLLLGQRIKVLLLGEIRQSRGNPTATSLPFLHNNLFHFILYFQGKNIL